MIGEIIKSRSKKGTGGGKDAFRPGTRYPEKNAVTLVAKNLVGDGWEEFSEQMLLASELNPRVQKPFYHVVLTWPPDEHPSEQQMLEAADLFLQKMGLEEHQFVIATHHNTDTRHVHIAGNTVHPVTGRCWSKSQDKLRAEKACREIEIAQGWSHDRGRFDFDVNEDGSVELKKNPEGWGRKQKDREAGQRQKSSRERKLEKRTGFDSFEQSISPALKDAFSKAVDAANTWEELHRSLRDLGLRYYKAGSGARVGLFGSKEYVKATTFGARFSFANLSKKLGEYEDHQPVKQQTRVPLPQESMTISAAPADGEYTFQTAKSFESTVTRRTYCNLFLEKAIADKIRNIDLGGHPPSITLKDNTRIVDHGSKITGTAGGDYLTTAKIMLAMAEAKGWQQIRFTGPPKFVQIAYLEAARQGRDTVAAPREIQKKIDAIRGETKTQQGSLENQIKDKQFLSLGQDRTREFLVNENRVNRLQYKAKVRESTSEIEDVLEDIKSSREPAHTALRQIARKKKKEVQEEIPKPKPKRLKSTNSTDILDREKLRRINQFIHSDCFDAIQDHTTARRRFEAAPLLDVDKSHIERLGISSETLSKFSNNVRLDAFGGLYFAHRNPDGGDIQGFERWREDEVIFEKGGIKSACVLGDASSASRVVVFDAGLEALAAAQVEEREDTLYVSIASEFTPRAIITVQSLAAGREVYSGFADSALGKALDAELCDIVRVAGWVEPPAAGCRVDALHDALFEEDFDVIDHDDSDDLELFDDGDDFRFGNDDEPGM